MHPIRFGTDGWRGVIADDFTFEGVRRVTQAVADLIHEEGGTAAPVPVGYDVRFLSRRFAECAAGVLEGNGFTALLPETATTTPMVSCQVVASAAPLGIAITASHNPPEWNGFKLKAAFGGSALPEMTERVEALLDRRAPRVGRAPLRRHPFLPSYVPRLMAVVDVAAIRKAPLRVVVDSMHGAGARILEDLARGGRTRVRTVRAEPDILFGGAPPEPRPEHLDLLRRTVLEQRAHLGLALDGDADRLGVIDERGRDVPPLQTFALLALHLLRVKGWRGGIARTFANTLLAARIARAHKVPFHDLPIGFKHIARLMLEDDILIGGEESGGIGVKRFLPERDGILIGLLLMEMLATGDRRLSRRIAAMQAEFGAYAYDRVDLRLPPRAGRRAVERLMQAPPDRLAGLKVIGRDTLDGLKLLFGDAGWILFRASGTEPVLRVYCEAATPVLVRRLLRAGSARIRKLAA
ncbi:MAG TPA: phosphoglucomutase/phosphomannomutase family protein [Candidatus Polarisedimenticolia bacterium]|nr:phosphoglucomutase/phosphomannomutase family protein [Candidatus Polarisedimenticolia bacterium]